MQGITYFLHFALPQSNKQLFGERLNEHLYFRVMKKIISMNIHSIVVRLDQWWLMI